MKAKKQVVALTKDEFRALLIRHAEQDAEKWEAGIQMFLPLEDVAWLEAFRKGAGR